MWAALWLLMAYLWLLQSSAGANAIHDMINAAPSGMSWLSSLQDGFASITNGNGFVFAAILSALSAAIGIGVGVNGRLAKDLLALSVVLQLSSTGSSARVSAVSSRAARPIPTQRRCSSCLPTCSIS